jgi:cytoskeletal protein CcmA (bactofilin family)
VKVFGRRRAPVAGEGLVVGPSDAVQGTVAAQAVTVAGRVQGTLDVAESLVIVESGRVSGTVRATRLVVEAGGAVRAECRVGLAPDEAVPALPELPRDERSAVLRLTPRSTERIR